ncbi:MAG: hypothetical protein RBG13Loki_0780 [Promethearchaeota archaeon CR_4]|nr:MAG: hypothetical protein RBG13Loki_0780 [Candidatus Lokiarchaeota archaeon CR_4]
MTFWRYFVAKILVNWNISRIDSMGCESKELKTRVPLSSLGGFHAYVEYHSNKILPV